MTDMPALSPPRVARVDEHPDADDFVMWVIYNRLTREWPGFYVLRRHWVHRATLERVFDPECWTAVDVEPLRAMVPAWLQCQPHQPGEDFTIEETWF